MRLVIAMVLLASAATAAFADEEPARRRACMNSSDSREAVSEHKLIDPLVAVRSAQSTVHAELLSSKLCQWGEEFVYEVTMLKRDGHVVRVFLSAKDGKTILPRAPR
jgi:uncharacterized membrane protein YkoI